MESARCRTCGSEVDPSAKRCPKCGQMPAEAGSQGNSQTFEVSFFTDICIVRFAQAQLSDMGEVERVGDDFAALIQDKAVRKLVVNFANVDYMSSAAIGKLITLRELVTAVGGQLKFCHMHANLQHIMRIMQLDRLVEICPTQNIAIDSFSD